MTRSRTIFLALGLLALAGCDPGPGHIPYTPNAAQGGGAAALRGGSVVGPAVSRQSSSPDVPGSLTK